MGSTAPPLTFRTTTIPYQYSAKQGYEDGVAKAGGSMTCATEQA